MGTGRGRGREGCVMGAKRKDWGLGWGRRQDYLTVVPRRQGPLWVSAVQCQAHSRCVISTCPALT